MSKGILVSGIKPTGKLHIGNYFGALKQFVDLQNEYECRFFVANLHALTTVHNAKDLKCDTTGIVLDYLAVGIDPTKATIFLQSDVPQVAELAWIFESLVTVPYMMRSHAFKAQVSKVWEKYMGDRKLKTIDEYLESRKKDSPKYDDEVERMFSGINMGILNYPLLMTADILIHDAKVVPVGADQKQHLEIAQDVAEKFNNAFGETFARPDPLIVESVATIPGTDGQKMSKSYNNVISLFAEDDEIEKAVMSIPTDSKGVNEPKDPENDTVFKLHTLVTPSEKLEDLRGRYEDGKIGYKESKEILIESLKNFIGPMRNRRKEWMSKEKEVAEIIKNGGQKMRASVDEKMKEVRERVGLVYN